MQGEISISKDVLPSLESDTFEPSSLGDPKGAIRQYRSASGVHVREYSDRFVIHVDTFDPRTDPIAHLLVDSPETILAFSTASFLSRRNSDNGRPGSVLSPFPFLFLFLSLNRIFRQLKNWIIGS